METEMASHFPNIHSFPEKVPTKQQSTVVLGYLVPVCFLISSVRVNGLSIIK